MDGGILTGLSAAGVFVVVLVALARTLLLDRSAFATQAKEIGDLRKEIGGLREHVAVIEAKYDEQRREKHVAKNDLAKAVMALGLVQRLARECSCNVLEPLEEIIGRLVISLPSLAIEGEEI